MTQDQMSSTPLRAKEKHTHLLDGAASRLGCSTARGAALIVQAAAEGTALQVPHHAGRDLGTLSRSAEGLKAEQAWGLQAA